MLALDLILGAFPPQIRSMNTPNLYLVRYSIGSLVENDYEESWETKISESPVCNSFVSINEMIDHTDVLK